VNGLFKIVSPLGVVVRLPGGVGTTSDKKANRFPAVWGNRVEAERYAQLLRGVVEVATVDEHQNQYAVLNG
jgi:hypothetical protein